MDARGGAQAPIPSKFAAELQALQEDPFVKAIAAFWSPLWQSSKALALGFTHNVLLYKPPVGIVTFIVSVQWVQKHVFQRNFLQVLDDFPLLNKRQRPKSLDIDATDREYNTAGGVQAPLLNELAPHSQLVVDYSACPPQASRCQCVRRLVDSVMEFRRTSPSNSSAPPQLESLLELRALDAMLRCVRDEDLLPSANRIRTAQNAWETKVNTWATSKRQYLKRVALRVLRRKPPSLHEWRTQLQSTTQALRDEYEQLGQVQQLLLQQPKGYTDPQQWTRMFLEWNQKAKQLLKDILTKRWSLLEDPTKSAAENRPESIGEDLQQLNQPAWSWASSSALVENSKIRYQMQLGGQSRRWRLERWKSMTRQLDWHGIPSVLVKIFIAHSIHAVLVPHWPRMKDTGLQVGSALWGIVEFRFYRPLKVIALDLLNRRPRLLDPAQLDVEQESLLNMLKDLGIQVDEMETSAALAEAARLYEQQLKGGAVKNMLFGQMVRLLLIQVQQLKADLVQAFKSIDELVDANRLNVSLLAAIPAFLLVRWGSRVMYSLLYRLRKRDLTGLKNAHMELTNLLREMERLLILAKGKQMSSTQLGEFVTCEQKYLLLLDYCQPPLSTKQVESIYKDVQDLLPRGGLDSVTQLNLLKLVQQKNAGLLKSI